MKGVLVYGSYGYTGELIVQEALANGIQPILSGRNEAKLKAQANKHKLDYHTISMDELGKLEKLLEQVELVIHCGGPFIHTAELMAKACIKTKTHYIDITGEYQVFELLQAFDEEAKQAGVMILPGAGFDVVPSDCLAAHLKKRLPDATNLELAFAGLGGGLSRGTTKTAIENMGYPSKVRQNGKLVDVPNAWHVKEIDFGELQHTTATISWGDISSAYRSTGIPNIEVTMGVTPALLKNLKRGNSLGWLLRNKWVKNFLLKQVDKRPAGPSDKRRAASKSFFWGKATNDRGQEVISTLSTPEGYTLTARTAIGISKKIIAGELFFGFQTPSTAYGSDHILDYLNCTRVDR